MQGYFAKYIINMAMEEGVAQSFSEVAGQIVGSIDVFELKEVSLNPFDKDLVLDIHMSSPQCGFLCHYHCDTCLTVFIKNQSRCLWDNNIPENTSNEEE